MPEALGAVLAVCLVVSPGVALDDRERAAMFRETQTVWQPHGVAVRADEAAGCDRLLQVKSDAEARPEDTTHDSALGWVPFVAGRARRVAGVTPCRAEASDPNPVVAIRMEIPNGLEVPDLPRAQKLASGIYQRAGVSLGWAPDETIERDRTLTIVLTLSTTVPPDLGSDAMGIAPSPGDGTRGTLAYVFLDKVQSFAASHRLSVAPVLACALAHEIGHLLLPPNAHRPDSVMRGGWHPALFPPRAPGILGFPPDQARLLRLRARR